MNNCKFCNAELPNSKGNKERVWCNSSCCTKFRYHNNPKANALMKAHSRKQNIKRRKDPNFRKEEKIRVDKWIRENRGRYNQLMRDYMRRKCKIKPENYRIKEKK